MCAADLTVKNANADVASFPKKRSPKELLPQGSIFSYLPPCKEFAILTDELTRAWSGMSTRQFKDFKGLKKESLRDNMSTTELTLNQLAEVATRELSQEEQPQGFDQSRRIAHTGGSIAKNARKELESHLGRPVITKKNASQLNHMITQMIEASIKV